MNMKKFKDFEMHQRRFTILAVVIFGAVAIGHVLSLLLGWDITIGSITLSPMVSVFATLMTAMMVIMGIYYASAK